jgi:phage/plasmid-associated DNA primase
VLNDATGGDVELAAYLQRVLGYTRSPGTSLRGRLEVTGPSAARHQPAPNHSLASLSTA